MSGTVLAVVAVVVALIALVVVLRRPAAGDGPTLRSDVNVLRETTNRSLQQLSDVFGKQLQGIGENVQTALASMRGELNQRLGENTRAMADTSKVVNDRMANVQSTFADLQKQVGELSGQARQLADLSKSVHGLENVLLAPKLRGGFGETQLENLLARVFPREYYEMQYRFGSSGEVADAVLKFPQGMVAVDSKFSLENFRKMAAAEGEEGKKSARREFLRDVKKRVDEVAGKYIRPAEGTLPFALMYVPAENVYYEAMLRDDDGADLYEHCMQRRVFPVSPNSLYAYLQTIVVGLNSLRISQRAESMLQEIAALELEMQKFSENYDKLGTHLRNAGKSYDDSIRVFDKVESRLERLAGNGAHADALGGEQAKLALEAESGEAQRSSPKT